MKDTIKLIGNTPMYNIKDTNVFVKLEKFNLGGSVKDRAVLGMLEDALDKKLIKEDTVIIEATSGNTGIALAMLGTIYNIPIIIIMPETMSVERRQLIKAYGAKLILTEGKKGMQGSLDEMNKLKSQNPNYISLSQFDNPANPNIHYETTGVEIIEEVSDIGVFVAGIGTGGTFTGVSRKLKEYNKDIITVALEPKESAILSGESAGGHKIQGIGANFIPKNFDRDLADEIIKISGDDALKETVDFAKETGILVGISSGANILAAKRLSEKYPDKKIVTIAPDGGEKYLSVLDFDWYV